MVLDKIHSNFTNPLPELLEINKLRDNVDSTIMYLAFYYLELILKYFLKVMIRIH
jgi:hypothetical protein